MVVRKKASLLVLLVTLIFVAASFTLWALADESIAASAAFSPPTSRPTPSSQGNESNARFSRLAGTLTDLGGEVGQQISGDLNSMEEDPGEFLKRPELDLLSRGLSQVLASPEGSAAHEQSRADPAITFRPMLNLVRVLCVQMRAELLAGKPDEAWQTVELGRGLIHLLYDNASTLIQLTAARSGQRLLLKEVVAGIDTEQWQSAQLEALLAQSPEQSARDALPIALKNEYEGTIEAIHGQIASHSPLARGYLYHPNRTANLWNGNLSDVISSLGQGRLAEVYTAGDKHGVAVPALDVLLGRNKLGYQATIPALMGCDAAIEGSFQASVRERLTAIRAALALFHNQHGRLPENLSALKDAYPQISIVDPWSATGRILHYDPSRGALYSLGFNQKDDGGTPATFDETGAVDDYGVRLARK